MDRVSCRQRLDEILGREIECVTALACVLEAEKEALAGRDPHALEETAKDKQCHIEELGELDRRRTELLKAAGFAADRAGLENCIQWCDADGPLLDRWRQLVSLLEKCRDQNLANGSLVELNRRRAEQVLAILRGQQADTRLYGSAGESVAHSLSRTLGWG